MKRIFKILKVNIFLISLGSNKYSVKIAFGLFEIKYKVKVERENEKMRKI